MIVDAGITISDRGRVEKSRHFSMMFEFRLLETVGPSYVMNNLINDNQELTILI